jgi:hypothetical protein
MGQPKVSKLEHGTQLPSDDDLVAWAEHTDPAALPELQRLLADARVEYVAFRRGDLTGTQERIRQMEARATRIREFQPAMVPALVQTAEYASAVLRLPPGPVGSGPLTPQDINGILGERTQRADVLHNDHYTVQIVCGETALHARPGGDREVLRNQLRKLLSSFSLPALDLRVLRHVDMPVVPVSGFRVLDNSMATVETLAGEEELSDPGVVKGYGEAFRLLHERSLSGPDALAQIRAALEALT